MMKQLPKKKNSKKNIKNNLNNLRAISKDEKNKIYSKTQLEMYEGSIPSPELLKGYDKLYKGSAKLMINNGVDESKHRRYLETSRQKRRGHLAYIALIGSIILMFVFIVASFFLILYKHTVSGSIFGATSFIVVIGELSDLSDVLSSNNDWTSKK